MINTVLADIRIRKTRIANIITSDEFDTIRLSKRDGKIYLPKDEGTIFILEKSGNFLYYHDDSYSGEYDFVTDIRYFFGGIDEGKPFLTQIEWGAMLAYIMHGENGFYDALMPDSVKKCVQVFGSEIKRQGEWFFAEIPYTWDQLLDNLTINYVNSPYGKISMPDPHKLSCIKLSNTNHEFTGLMHGWLKIPELLSEDGETQTICEGIITATDHKPLELVNLHVIKKSNYLVEPD